MYCSDCGALAAGKFCSACGARIAVPGGVPRVVDDDHGDLDVDGDWSQIVDYQTLLRHADVRARIAQAAAECKHSLSGEQFLEFCEKALGQFTVVPIPYNALAKIAQPLSASLGIETGKSRVQSFRQPVGTVLVAVLCSLARHGRKVKAARPIENGCALDAEFPSDIFALAGEIRVVVRRQGEGTIVEAATHIPGALFDWGKSHRCLEQLLGETAAAA